VEDGKTTKSSVKKKKKLLLRQKIKKNIKKETTYKHFSKTKSP